MSSSARAARPCRSAWGSTPARWSCAPSAATCTWTTRPSVRQRTSPPAWSRWQSPAPRSSPTTPCKLAEGYVAGRPLGAVPVKGLESRDDVYELTGVGAGPVPAPGHRRPRLHPLRRPRARARGSSLRPSSAPRAGHGQVVAVVGEAGLGKSRLVWEFIRSHRTHGWLVLESSVGLLREGHAVPARHRPDEGLFPDPGARRPSRRCASASPASSSCSTASLEPTPARLAGAARRSRSTMPGWDALDRSQRRQRTLEAVKRLLLRESQVQPLLVLFEDLHWIDFGDPGGARRARREPADGPRSCSWSTIAPSTSTPGAARPTTSSCGSIHCRPRAPTRCSTRCSARTMTGSSPLKQRLIERTEGNPFFLEESVRTLVETQVLGGRARGLSNGASRSTPGRFPPRPRPSWRRASTGCPPRTSGSSRPPPSSGRMCRSRCSKPSPSCPTRARAGLWPSPGGRVPLRDQPVPRSRVHLQARADPRGRLWEPPPRRRRALHAADRRGHRDAPRRAPDGARRAARSPRRAGRALGQGRDLPPAGRCSKAFARSANREAAAAFEQALAALTHLPETRETIEQGRRRSPRSPERALAPRPSSRPASVISRTPSAWPTTLDDRRRLGWIAAYLSEHTRQTGHAADAPPVR